MGIVFFLEESIKRYNLSLSQSCVAAFFCVLVLPRPLFPWRFEPVINRAVTHSSSLSPLTPVLHFFDKFIVSYTSRGARTPTSETFPGNCLTWGL